MEFCEGPEQALAIMSQTPYDVVITDMRMPVMDGADLLTEIRELYPGTIRIVLSGQSEQERILRAVGPAHQYLSKPCDPEFLRATIRRVSLLSQRIQKPEMKALVSRMDSLPSLPSIYFELLEELKSEDASVDCVGKLISKDVSMTAKVLQVVNSSFFGLPVHINDAQHAAALLGLNTLKPLVLTASIFRQLEDSRVSAAYLEKVFSHSLEVGGIAKALAKAEGLGKESADNAFIGGALHDVGKVVLGDNFGQEYVALCQDSEAQGNSTSELERKQFGATHADVGGFLLGLWGLPQEIIEAVAYHHEPDTGIDEGFSTLSAVYVANLLCSEKAKSEGQESLIDEGYLARLGLQDRVEAWRQIAEELAAPV